MIEKNYGFFGPLFEILENPGETKILSLENSSTFLPWHHSEKPVVARHTEMYSGKISDVFIVINAFAVSNRFRDVVEQFEPGMHGFAPLKLYRKNDALIEGEYFLFSAQQDLDCLITDNNPSLFEDLGTLADDRKHILCRLTEPGRPLSMSRPQIEGKHLWTAGLLGLNHAFCSDDLQKAFKKARLSYRRIDRHCVELDRPWIAEEQMGPLLPRWKAYVASGRTVVDYTRGDMTGYET
jgi:hypothetical protein